MTNPHNPAPYSGTLFFDVNETLLDTTELNRSVSQRLGDRPERAEARFTSLLHHSLVESVTGSWNTFGDIAEAVLEMTATRYGVTLPKNATPIAEIIAAMPAHPDVAAGLTTLQQQGFTTGCPDKLFCSAGRKAAQFSRAGATVHSHSQRGTGAGL